MQELKKAVARLSDEELRGRVFEITDPQDQENYIEIIPDGANVLDCETYYDLKSWRHPCGIASCRTKHMKGFGVLLDTGQRSNIGHNCGSKHFGAEFEDLKSRMDYNDRRAKFLRRREPLDKMIDEALGLLELWRRPMRQMQRLGGLISTFSRPLYDELEVMYRRHGGAPMVHRKVRDRAAEHQRDERIHDDHPEYGKPIYRDEEYALSERLPGKSVFTSIGPSDKISDVVVDLRQLKPDSEEDALTNSQLQGVFTKLRNCTDLLEKLADLSDDAHRFCTPGVWQEIAAWQRQLHGESGITYKNREWALAGRRENLTIPDLGPAVDRKAIEILRQRPDLETVEK